MILFVMTSCAKNDRERINGTWSFYELKGSNGKTAYSADSKKQKQIVDDMVKEQAAMYAGSEVNENMLRQMITEQFKVFGKVTFTFTENGMAKVQNNSGDKSQDNESKFIMDEKKKELTIKYDSREMKYKYSFDDDKLTLKGEEEEITLIRKGK
jgi:hypothetical protein